MSRILFFVRSYNDLDHFHPLIAAAAPRWPKLSIVACTTSDLANDYRIRDLCARGARFHRFALLNGLMERKLLGRLLRATTKLLRRPLGVLLRRADVGLLCYEMSGPGGHGIGKLFFSPAKASGIPVIALPHGLNIYLNTDMTTEIRRNLRENGALPNFSDRNQYDRYVLQTEHHKETSVTWGQDAAKILVLGSPRFTRDGALGNLARQKQSFSAPQLPPGRRVLFLYPHWNYNVDVDRTVDFLRRLSNFPGICVVVKPHTRNGSDLDRYPENEISKLPLTYSDLPTPILIEASDLLINLGSSAGIDALWLEKPLVYPKYLHDNTTVFDRYDVSYNPGSWEEMEQILDRLVAGILVPRSDDGFIRDVIYGGVEGAHPTDRHLQLFQELLRER
jgi:hypothetical protein